jgi:hypothetical protein
VAPARRAARLSALPVAAALLPFPVIPAVSFLAPMLAAGSDAPMLAGSDVISRAGSDVISRQSFRGSFRQFKSVRA